MKNAFIVLRLVSLTTAALSAHTIKQPAFSEFGGVEGAPAQPIQHSIFQFIKSSPLDFVVIKLCVCVSLGSRLSCLSVSDARIIITNRLIKSIE